MSTLVDREVRSLHTVGAQIIDGIPYTNPLLARGEGSASEWKPQVGQAPSKLALAVCIPYAHHNPDGTLRWIPPEFSLALGLLQGPPNSFHCFLATKGQRRDEARCDMMKQARELGARYALFIDDDNPPPPDTISKLMYQLDNADDDVAVCGGIYTSKTYPPVPLVFHGDGTGAYWRWKAELRDVANRIVRQGDVFECERLATGCMMIRLSVFDHLDEPWFRDIESLEEAKRLGHFHADYGPSESLGHEVTTDDMYFCAKVRRAGFRILAHGGVLPAHWDQQGREFRLPADSYPMRP
jgi:hypothetical protein